MATTMTPSDEGITLGQIGKAQELFGAALRKSGLPSTAVQHVLEKQGAVLAEEWLAVLRKRVEAVSNTIVRHVRVDRTRTPEEALDATGRRQYVDSAVVAGMPRGEFEEVDVYFFKVDRFVNDADLEKEYATRGFVPADVYTCAAVSADDPAFADTRPYGTHWKDADGRWCFATFSRWDDDERSVHVGRSGDRWVGLWWFAGVRKS